MGFRTSNATYNLLGRQKRRQNKTLEELNNDTRTSKLTFDV